MGYFPRMSPNSLKICPKRRVNVHIQSPTDLYLLIKTKSFLLNLKGHFISFNLIYWTPICGKYGKMAVFPGGYGRIEEIQHERLRPDWSGVPTERPFYAVGPSIAIERNNLVIAQWELLSFRFRAIFEIICDRFRPISNISLFPSKLPNSGYACFR